MPSYHGDKYDGHDRVRVYGRAIRKLSPTEIRQFRAYITALHTDAPPLVLYLLRNNETLFDRAYAVHRSAADLCIDLLRSS